MRTVILIEDGPDGQVQVTAASAEDTAECRTDPQSADHTKPGGDDDDERHGGD